MYAIIRQVYSIVVKKDVYELEWLDKCSEADAIKKLKEFRRLNKKDKYFLMNNIA
jgi:hypothetical protein